MTSSSRGPGDSPSLHGLLNSSSQQEASGVLERLDPHNDNRHAGVRSSAIATSQQPTHHFTLRALVVGLFIGVLICFCNTYFGLQTGWGSGMSLSGSLLGFAIFRSIRSRLTLPFTPVENVLVQSVASAVGTMPLGCGFAGIIPAMEFLLEKNEGAPIGLGVGRLIIWSLGVSLFGSVFALTLRKQMIIREKLRFPSGTATALLIRVLHGKADKKSMSDSDVLAMDEDEAHGLLGHAEYDQDEFTAQSTSDLARSVEQFSVQDPYTAQDEMRPDVRDKYVQFLVRASSISAIFTIFTYFVPQTHDIPILGPSLANDWLWTLNLSPAYIGQGAIMGPTTTLHMLLGAIVGWGILAPVSWFKGWAPGPVDDWEQGSKGWIMWISLAILLADSLTNLGWLILRPLVTVMRRQIHSFTIHVEHGGNWHDFIPLQKMGKFWFVPLQQGPGSPKAPATSLASSVALDRDAPPQQLISNTTTSILLPLALSICVLFVHLSFGSYIPVSLTILATVLAVVASLMGVRALGETDICPASGISKLTQLLFALIAGDSPNAVIINLLTGTISDSGASQASDLMQDLKTGHLLNASPRAQFYGQIIGSVVGVVVAPIVYRLYAAVYELPSRSFQLPGAYIWIFSARLLVGKGLPPMAWQCGLIAGIIFVSTTISRIYIGSQNSANTRNLLDYIPGGIAFAVGIYVTPSFTLPRAIGGVLSWYYVRFHGKERTSVVVIASGLVLGEGVFSMVNLGLASLNIPHL